VSTIENLIFVCQEQKQKNFLNSVGIKEKKFKAAVNGHCAEEDPSHIDQ